MRVHPTHLRLSQAISLDRATPEAHWSPEEMRVLIPQINRYGEPLTWSHWRALTRVAATLTRRELVAQCSAEGWTVRQVIARRRHQETRGKNDDVSEGQSIRVALDEGRRDASRAVHALGMFVDALRSVYGSNPNLKGPNGEPWERLTGLDSDGEIVKIDHHSNGHSFSDDNTFELPHGHGPSGEHLTYGE